MALNFTSGKIIHIGQIISGVSASGKEWQNQTIVLETENNPNSISRIALKVFGEERVGKIKLFRVGDFVRVGWAISASEFKGRWYNDVDLCTIESEREGRAPERVVKAVKEKAEPSPAPVEADPDKDLPF